MTNISTALAQTLAELHNHLHAHILASVTLLYTYTHFSDVLFIFLSLSSNLTQTHLTFQQISAQQTLGVVFLAGSGNDPTVVRVKQQIHFATLSSFGATACVLPLEGFHQPADTLSSCSATRSRKLTVSGP